MLTLFNLIADIEIPDDLDGPSKEIELGGFKPPTEAYSTGSEISDGVAAAANAEQVISNVIGFLTILGGVFFVIHFVTGALQWITSGGDKGKVETARNKMTNGAIGMIIIVATYAILGLLSGLIGFDLLKPGEAIINLNPLSP